MLRLGEAPTAPDPDPGAPAWAPPCGATAPVSPQRLAALGVVLCLYRARTAELDGWRRAVRVEARTALHAGGLDESLQFLDRGGRCCWRLFLLPDSDFLAWDALAATLPPAAPAGGGVAERLWRRFACGVSGAAWHCSALRLAVASGDGAGGRLTASLATLSTLGAEVAQRIARSEGVDAGRLDDRRRAVAVVKAAARTGAPAARRDPFRSHPR